MRDRHVRIEGAKLLFRFRGKSGQEHTIELTDRRLARIVKQCQELPGLRAVPVRDGKGKICAIDSGDVNRLHSRAIRTGFHSQGFSHLGRNRAGRPRISCRRALHQREGRKRTIVEGGEERGAAPGKSAGDVPEVLHSSRDHRRIHGRLSIPVMEQGEQQHAAYAGLGLRPEEYSVMVIVAENQQKLAALARAS